jgi:hypothetical protein
MPPLHMAHLREDEVSQIGKRLREIARRREEEEKKHNKSRHSNPH